MQLNVGIFFGEKYCKIFFEDNCVQNVWQKRFAEIKLDLQWI